MARIVIVGAGISGLSVAYRLQQTMPAANVTVLEQRERPGGTIWTEQRDGFRIETGPNGFLDTKPATLTLCQDLGLAERLVAASTASSRNRYLFLDGRLQRLPNGLWSFLSSGLLGWRGKLSLLTERFRSRPPPTVDESITDFASRRTSREVAEVLADALVTGIHAGDPALLSIRATFPRLATLEQQHGSVLKGLAQAARQRRAEAKARGEVYRRPGQMWSFREGLRLLVETLHERLAHPPMLGVTVRGVRQQSTGARPEWIIQGDGQDQWTADAVVLACPAYRQAAVLAELDPELAERIAAIAYNRVVVVALGYRRAEVPFSLDGFGFIAPQRTRRDLLGVQWCSSIFPERAPPDLVLLRAICGGWHRPEIVDWDDARLVQAVRAELRLAMGVEASPVLHHIVRWDRAIPQYHLGHLDRVAAIERQAARHPGLFLGGNAYHGVALNDCSEQGEEIARRLARYLAPNG